MLDDMTILHDMKYSYECFAMCLSVYHKRGDEAGAMVIGYDWQELRSLQALCFSLAFSFRKADLKEAAARRFSGMMHAA